MLACAAMLQEMGTKWIPAGDSFLTNLACRGRESGGKTAALQKKRSSDAVEGFLDFFYGVAEDHGAAVGAAHGAIGFGEGGEEPFHFGLVERHVDFDGGVAGGGGGGFGLLRLGGGGGILRSHAVGKF